MGGTILVVSHTHDVHGLEVLGHLTRGGADAVLFDTGRLPRETRLVIRHGGPEWEATARFDGRTVDLRAVRSVWWRRPQPFALHAEIAGPEDQSFALGEIHAAMAGLWTLLDAKWINDPDADDRAARKAWQLEMARAAGLRVPRTCITNDPDTARAFVADEPGRVIYKAFSATERTWRETRVLRDDERDRLEAVRFAPVIFQEYVAAAADLRVTVVGEQVFPAAIRVPENGYEYDFRVAMEKAVITATTLPDAVQASLLRLMRRLGLIYGAIDLRLTPAGEHVFLEVNPAGQWLFVEQQTGQPIAAALADRLAAWAA